jgi:hypothetical protein
VESGDVGTVKIWATRSALASAFETMIIGYQTPRDSHTSSGISLRSGRSTFCGPPLLAEALEMTAPLARSLTA